MSSGSSRNVSKSSPPLVERKIADVLAARVEHVRASGVDIDGGAVSVADRSPFGRRGVVPDRAVVLRPADDEVGVGDRARDVEELGVGDTPADERPASLPTRGRVVDAAVGADVDRLRVCRVDREAVVVGVWGGRRVLRDPGELVPAVVGHPELRSGCIDVVRLVGVGVRRGGDPAPEPVGDRVVADRAGGVPGSLPRIARRSCAAVDARAEQRPGLRCLHLQPRVKRGPREREPDGEARDVARQFAATDAAPIDAAVRRLVDAGGRAIGRMREGREQVRRIRCVDDEVIGRRAGLPERARPRGAAVRRPQHGRAPEPVQPLRVVGPHDQHGAVESLLAYDELPAVAAVFRAVQTGASLGTTRRLGTEQHDVDPLRRRRVDRDRRHHQRRQVIRKRSPGGAAVRRLPDAAPSVRLRGRGADVDRRRRRRVDCDAVHAAGCPEVQRDVRRPDRGPLRDST